MSKKPKVIVIGAGAAGLATAARLLENNFNDIIILEAEDRIGGRVHSVQFADTIVDLGGQWCHGEKNNVVFEMVKDLDLLSKSHNEYDDFTYYLSNGEIPDKALTNRITEIAFDIVEDEEKARQVPGSFGEYFIKAYKEKIADEFSNNTQVQTLSEQLLDWLQKILISLDSAKSLHELSTTSFYAYKKCEGNQYWQWRNKGYRTILDVIMRKIPATPTKQIPIEDKVHLNKEVVRILWDSDDSYSATVECADNTQYQADHVIVTVSLGVLKHLVEAFEPPLSASKRNAIALIPFGTVNKILLKFGERWWPSDTKGFSLLWTPADRAKLHKQFPESLTEGASWLEDVYGFYPVDSHPLVLLGWVVGAGAERMEARAEAEVQEGCLFLLRMFVGAQHVVPDAEVVLRTRWRSSRHFRGAYSYRGRAAEEGGATSAELARPAVDGRGREVVLFAGEATEAEHFSTVHGAIESGFREAERILGFYRPTSPPPTHHKVLIIGAGAAGLSAASTLHAAAFTDFLLLEAQQRTGGRVHSLVHGDQLLELGAQWIHGTDNALHALAARHRLLSPIRSEEKLGVYVLDDGTRLDPDLVARVDFEVGRILGECEQFAHCNVTTACPLSVYAHLRRSFAAYASDDPLKWSLFDWHVRFQQVDNACGDLRSLSARGWGRYQCADDAAHVNLTCAYERLLDLVAAPFAARVRLGTPVERVDRAARPIRLRARGGERFTCDYLIVTASLGVLNAAIEFRPPLPAAHAESIERLGYGAIAKIFLVFEARWWSFEGVQLVWRGEEGEGEGWVRQVQGFDSVVNADRTLLGWVGGDAVEEVEGLDEERVGICCVKLLRRFLPGVNIPKPVKVIRTTWRSNEWIRGSYSHITSKCDELDHGMHRLAEPIFANDKNSGILFAGEATHPSHYSTVHGAFETGQDQANKLLPLLRKEL